MEEFITFDISRKWTFFSNAIKTTYFFCVAHIYYLADKSRLVEGGYMWNAKAVSSLSVPNDTIYIVPTPEYLGAYVVETDQDNALTGEFGMTVINGYSVVKLNLPEAWK